LRKYKTIPARIRPDDQMVGHTGYLIFARAVEREIEEADEQAAEADTTTDADDTQEVPAVRA